MDEDRGHGWFFRRRASAGGSHAAQSVFSRTAVCGARGGVARRVRSIACGGQTVPLAPLAGFDGRHAQAEDEGVILLTDMVIPSRVEHPWLLFAVAGVGVAAIVVVAWRRRRGTPPS